MKVPFTWKPTGWFMIGWSAEIPPGTVKPLQYLGEHLVAYRTDAGKLAARRRSRRSGPRRAKAISASARTLRRDA